MQAAEHGRGLTPHAAARSYSAWSNPERLFEDGVGWVAAGPSLVAAVDQRRNAHSDRPAVYLRLADKRSKRNLGGSPPVRVMQLLPTARMPHYTFRCNEPHPLATRISSKCLFDCEEPRIQHYTATATVSAQAALGALSARHIRPSPPLVHRRCQRRASWASGGERATV
jgi:hypothetical protein